MIRLAKSNEQRGCTDFSTALTAVVQRCMAGIRLCCHCWAVQRAAGAQTAHPAYLGGSGQPILQRKSFAIDGFPSKRKPGSRDVPSSDPSTNTPPARGKPFLCLVFQFNHSDGLALHKKGSNWTL
jgi:hypothetical protein